MKVNCPNCNHAFDTDEVSAKGVIPETQTIVDMIEIFSKVNPTINYGHRGYRKDALTLIKKLGAEKALRAAEFAVEIQGQPFSPTITTPTALKYKLGDLIVFHKKSTSGRTIDLDNGNSDLKRIE
jgi:hypothetical protein